MRQRYCPQTTVQAPHPTAQRHVLLEEKRREVHYQKEVVEAANGHNLAEASTGMWRSRGRQRRRVVCRADDAAWTVSDPPPPSIPHILRVTLIPKGIGRPSELSMPSGCRHKSVGMGGGTSIGDNERQDRLSGAVSTMGRPRFSRAWIDRLRALDGVVYVKKLRGEDLTDVRFSSITSDGYRAYVDKVAEIPGDPTLDPLVAPQAVFLQGVPMAAQAARMHEASQIIDEARFWRVDHIQGGVPPIPLPVRSGIPQGSGFHVHHASVAVSALNHAICNPGPATPVLLALAQGDYICSLLHAWSNVVFSFPLHRQ